ncbi:MAG: sulfatase [Planctomycetota bacterium]
MQSLRRIAAVVFCTALAWTKPAVSQPTGHDNDTTAHQPNIILLFVDDLGWNDLGYRNPKFETPHIDRLAGESLDFQRAYIASPTCSPSRATLLTGKHPARLKIVRHIPTGKSHGFDEFGRTEKEFNQYDGDPAKFPCRNWLPLEHTTYAEALGRLGYYNFFAGKWHLGHEPYHPIHQGFDEQFGTTNFGHPKSYNAPFFRNTDVLADVQEGHLTNVLTDESVRFIEEYDREKPFMLSLWYYGVHRPPVGRQDLVRHFQEKGYDESDAIYAAQVKAIDESVGRIRESLVKKGIDKETILVFLSDQGSWYQNLPLRGSKRVDTLCEGGARVPFLFHWPGMTGADRRSDSLVQSTDLFPTLVEIAGGDAGSYADLDGVSLLPLVLGTQTTLKRDAPLIGYRAYQDLYASVREGNWNLLAYRSGKVGLFDVIEDVGEQQDVAEQYPDVVRELTQKLIAWENEMNVQEYSGVQDSDPNFQHLFSAKLVLRRIEQVDPTPEQLDHFNRLSRTFKADVLALRESAGITKDTIKIRDKAYRSVSKTGLKGDAFWLKLQQEAGITDEQRVAFRKTKDRSNRFKADARALLTPEQRANLPKNKKP